MPTYSNNMFLPEKWHRSNLMGMCDADACVAQDSPEDDGTKELAFVLYDSSLITAGFDIDDQV